VRAAVYACKGAGRPPGSSRAKARTARRGRAGAGPRCAGVPCGARAAGRAAKLATLAARAALGQSRRVRSTRRAARAGRHRCAPRLRTGAPAADGPHLCRQRCGAPPAPDIVAATPVPGTGPATGAVGAFVPNTIAPSGQRLPLGEQRADNRSESTDEAHHARGLALPRFSAAHRRARGRAFDECPRICFEHLRRLQSGRRWRIGPARQRAVGARVSAAPSSAVSGSARAARFVPLTRGDCPSGAREASAASFAARPRDEQHRKVGAQHRPPRLVAPPGQRLPLDAPTSAQMRSNTAAMPWPPPMHIVTSACRAPLRCSS